MNPPGSLTPIGYSPLPYSQPVNVPSFPMVTMNTSPSVQEINSLAQEISNIFSNPPTPLPPVQSYGFPTVSLPPVQSYGLPTVSLPSVQNYGLPTVSLPSVQNYGLPTVSLPSVQNYGLPTVSLPQNYGVPSVSLPSAQNYGLPSVALPTVSLPQNYGIPSVSLPSVQNYGLPLVQFPYFKSNLLSDNEIGDLRWNRADPPIPINPESSYRRVGCIGDGSCFFHAISKGLSENYQLSYKNFDNISESTLRKLETSVGNAMIFPSSLFTTPRTNNLNEVYVFVPYNNFKDLMSQYRRLYVKLLRADFARQVLNDAKMQATIRKRLSGSIDLNVDILLAESLERGQNIPIEQIQTMAFQKVLRDLAEELLSGNSVQPDFMTLLSDQIGIDIYLIRDRQLTDATLPDTTTPLYGRALHDTVHGPADLRDTDDIYYGEPNRNSIVIIAVDDIHYEIIARIDEGGEIQTKMNEEEPLIRRLYTMLKTVRYIT